MNLNNSQKVFFELLRAGLFGNENLNMRIDETTDWQEVYRLAAEQSVLGLVLAGVEHSEVKPPQMLLLQWIGEVQIIELQNKEMNAFIAELIEKLRKNDVYAILVKGQGIAQCYEKPLWRASGDVDLLLSELNYDKAKKVLLPLATSVETEYTHFKHQGMTIDGFIVELHGTLHSRLSKRVDDCIDAIQRKLFYGGKVKSVRLLADPSGKAESKSSGGSEVQVFLPAPDEDVIFVFTHILHHFFLEGIGLRQICDWCRLLWTYKDSLNHGLLESRIKKMGLMSEWKAFAAFGVKWLGMPVDAMPLYSADVRWESKADRICSFVLEVGNFGHKQKRDYNGMSYLRRKFVSTSDRIHDMLRHFQIFPKDSIVFFVGVLRTGLYAAVHGE